MKKSKKLTISLTLAIALVAFIVLTSRNSSGKEAASTSTVVPVAVEITPVDLSTLTETVSAVGTVSAMRDVLVSSETSGRVTRVFAKAGDYVRAGQVLAQVDDELKGIAVDQAKAQLAAAETNFNKSQKDYDRAQNLRSAGDVSDAEVEAYSLAFRSAEAQLKSAQANVRYVQRQYDDAKIKAPISGYVASKKVEVGEMVTPGKEIANIVDLSSMKIKLSIPEEEIGKLRLKQPATLRLDADPSKVLTGVVYSVGSKTETPMGHTYPVEVVVENKGVTPAKVGMFARVEIRAGSTSRAMAISKESLVNEDVNPMVFVAEDNIAKARPVKLGLRSGNVVQVIEGLREGDLVISFGQKKLKDGAPIQYKR